MQLKGFLQRRKVLRRQGCALRGKYSGKREGNVFFMNSNTIVAKQKADSSFRKCGVIFAMMFGVTYGL